MSETSGTTVTAGAVTTNAPPQPPQPPAMVATSAPTPLWGGLNLPVVGVTGELGSGKTLFLLTIDPHCFDRAAPPRTLAWDTEDSATPYVDIFGFEHRPLTAIMLRPGYKPEHLYLEWLKEMRAIQPGQYRVGYIDTVSEIEEGLCDWVRQHPEHFNHTKGQYAKMEGLFWGDVKSLWKQHLSEAAARFECFAFASHAKAVWKGNSPTKERTAKGKETLKELASLYFWLDRTPKPGAKKAPTKPSGTIFAGKNRLVRLNQKTGELEPILPPRLPECTPDAIRTYVETPVDYGNLKASERAVEEKPLTEDERLLVSAGIAQDQAAASQAELSRVEMMRQAAVAQAAAMGTPLGSPQQPRSAAAVVTAEQPRPAPPAAPDPSAYSAKTADPGTITQEQRHEIINLFQQLGIDQAAARDIIARRGCEQFMMMSFTVADELIEKLKEKRGNPDIPF